MGLFGPVWLKASLQGKSMERALEEVRTLNDQDKLREAVLKSHYRQIKEAALDRILDESVLKDIFKSVQSANDAWIRFRIIERINDQDFLYSIAGSFSKSGMPVGAAQEKQAAIRRLTSTDQLNEIMVRADQLSRSVAPVFRSFMTDLSATANQRLISLIRLSTSQEEILRFENSGNSFVRKAASMRMHELSKSSPVTEEAGSRTEELQPDPLIMTDSIYKRAEAENAVRKISDQKMLAVIAKKAPLPGVRLSAVRKLEDQALLEEIALDDSDYSVKEMASKNLKDPGILRDFALKVNNINLIKGHLSKLKEPDLIEVAKSGRDFQIRRAAVECIRDQATLADIAISGNEGAQTAVSPITDPVQLRRVFENTQNGKIKALAIEKAGGYLCKNCGTAVWPENEKEVPCVCPGCGTENHAWEFINNVKDYRDYSAGTSWYECKRCGAKKDMRTVNTM